MYVFLFLSTLNWDSLLIRCIKLEEKKERKYQYIMHHSFMRKLALYETEPVTQIPAINRNPQKKPHERSLGRFCYQTMKQDSAHLGFSELLLLGFWGTKPSNLY